MEWLFELESWIALGTLTALEIVLGIDNVVFISILAAKLPPSERARARRLGLSLAMLMRIGLLFSLAWLTRLTSPLLSVLGQSISGRDLVLIVGGLFLVGKSTLEIHTKLEGESGHASARVHATLLSVIAQVCVLDIVFSLDSVITAVGMVDELAVMVVAIVLAVGVMMVFAGAVSEFVERHPTVKMLALSFLILIGVTLIADGLGQHVPKGYIYFAMAFSVGVELLNLRLRRIEGKVVQLRQPYLPESTR